MKLSELISILQNIHDNYGDVPCATRDYERSTVTSLTHDDVDLETGSGKSDHFDYDDEIRTATRFVVFD
jgi:hypothetical protein